jgi:Ni,Fe-hydrogenase I large subunit
MATEGTIDIRLDVTRGRVASVTIGSTRPVRAAQVLSGRSPSEAQRLASLLFPVCGVAQGVACARALDAALGRAAGPRLEALRDVACLAEAAVSHVWQLAIAWPEASSAPVDPASVRGASALAEQLRLILFGAEGGAPPSRPEWAVAQATARSLADLVRERATSDSPLVAAVTAAHREAFGLASTATLRSIDAKTVGRLLASDPTFSEDPQLEEGPVDVSAYARQATSEGVRDVEAAHGRGLITRLVARRVDALADADRLEAGVAAAEEAPVGDAGAPGAGGEGIGLATTARGPLCYWVRADESSVRDVRVVAPTDWTFHPRGAVRQALVSLDATPTLARDVGWLVLALDPCVPWSVEVCDA